MDEEEEKAPVRRCGFDRPFHPLQVLSWGVFALDVLTYAFVGLPLIAPRVGLVLVAICYVVSVCVLIVATANATSCDPMDPRVANASQKDSGGEEDEELPYCPICDVMVAVRSKHCRTCNKCVDTFDHHCMWLNNCIGAANYRWFFVAVSSAAIMTGILFATCIYLLVDYCLDEDLFGQRAQTIPLFSRTPKEVLLGFILTLIAVNAPLFFLDLQLVVLHMFLMSQQLTTYEYIMSKHDRQEAQAREKEGLETDEEGGSFKKKIHTLPHCMDWIVFCRCGQRRRRKHKDNENVDTEDVMETPPPSPQQTEPEEEAPSPRIEAENRSTFTSEGERPEPEEEGSCGGGQDQPLSPQQNQQPQNQQQRQQQQHISQCTPRNSQNSELPMAHASDQQLSSKPLRHRIPALQLEEVRVAQGTPRTTPRTTPPALPVDVVHIHDAIEMTQGNVTSELPQPRQQGKERGMQKPSGAAPGCSVYTGPAGCFFSVGCNFPG